MSRAERLLELLAALRRHRAPVSADALGRELSVSVRTLYRDIASLKAQGARIEGEPGLGYVLRPGFVLPPLMFREDEVEAVVLGLRWVMDRGDTPLGEAAQNVLAKLAAVLPPELRHELETSAMLVGPGEKLAAGDRELSDIRAAIRAEKKLHVTYRDQRGNDSERVVWPFALGFFDRVRMVVAWCELRTEFRHFRTDRIRVLHVADARYPRRRQALLKEWRAREGIPER